MLKSSLECRSQANRASFECGGLYLERGNCKIQEWRINRTLISYNTCGSRSVFGFFVTAMVRGGNGKDRVNATATSV